MSTKKTRNGNPDNIIEAMGFDQKPLFEKYEAFFKAHKDQDYSDILKKVAAKDDWTVEEKLLYAFMEGKWVCDMEWKNEMAKTALAVVGKKLKEQLSQVQEEAPNGTVAH